jgi:hypothetical protein
VRWKSKSAPQPAISSRCNVCFYPDGILAGGAELSGLSHWRFPKGGPITYRDDDAISGGISMLKMAGSSRGTSLFVKGIGETLADNLLPLSSFTIALIDRENDRCLISEFTEGKSEPGRFRARTSL